MPLVANARITRTGAVAAVFAIAVSIVLALLGSPVSTGVAAVIAVTLIALGSPHGALDHLVLLGEPDSDNTALSVLRGLSARFVVGYAGLALVALGAYALAPRTGFAMFLLLSIAHFAAGEAGVAIERGLARGWSDPVAWVSSLGGGLIVLLPLASREAGVALSAVDPRLAPVLAPLPVLADVVAILAIVAVLACVVAAVRGHDGARTVALELGTLTALATLAHPLIAFATFFAFWHALRHQARLAQTLRGTTGNPPVRYVDRPLREVADSARAGLPATAGVLIVAVGLVAGGATLLGGLLAVIWALTVPHSVAVAVLEVRSARSRGARTRRGPGGTAGNDAASNRHDKDDHAIHPPGRPAGGPPAPRRAERLRGSTGS